MTSYPSAEVLAQEGPLALEAFGEMVTGFSTVRRVVSGALTATSITWSLPFAAGAVCATAADLAAGRCQHRRAAQVPKGRRLRDVQGAAQQARLILHSADATNSTPTPGRVYGTLTPPPRCRGLPRRARAYCHLRRLLSSVGNTVVLSQHAGREHARRRFTAVTGDPSDARGSSSQASQ